jgi:hypothetical protein
MIPVSLRPLCSVLPTGNIQLSLFHPFHFRHDLAGSFNAAVRIIAQNAASLSCASLLNGFFIPFTSFTLE